MIYHDHVVSYDLIKTYSQCTKLCPHITDGKVLFHLDSRAQTGEGGVRRGWGLKLSRIEIIFFLFYSQLTWFRFFFPFHLLLLLESDMVFQEVQPWGQPGEGALQTNLYLFLRSKTQRQISINQPNMICWLSLDGKLVWTSLGTTWIEGEIMEFFWTFYQEFH